MYIVINKRPIIEDINLFKMQENINENFINFCINPNTLSLEDKKNFIAKYKLEAKVFSYKDTIFLVLANTNL